MLHLVEKCDARGTPRHTHAVDGQTGNALMRAVAGVATDGDMIAARHLLAEAHQKNYWIACGCQVDGDKPLVVVAYRQDRDTYYLRRMESQGRRPHAEGCPFTTRKETRLAGSQGTNKHPVDHCATEAPLPDDADLYTLNAQGEHISAEPNEPSMGASMDHSPSRPHLARIMFHILERAGVNSIGPERAAALKERAKLSGTVRDQYHAIRQAAEKMRLCDGIALSECLWLHPDEITKARAFHKLRSLSGRWPANILPQGYLLTVVEDVADGHIQYRGGTKIRVTGEIRKFAPDNSVARAPYWVIALVAQAGRKGYFEVMRAYAHPVFNASLLIPVDSDYERETLKILLSMQAWSMTNGMSPWIAKPLHNLTPPGSTSACRPDFIIGRKDAPGRVVIVETMGFDDEAYRVRKARIHADCMSTLGEVVTHSPYLGPEHTSKFRHELASSIRKLQYKRGEH